MLREINRKLCPILSMLQILTHLILSRHTALRESDGYISPSGRIIYFTVEDMDQNVSPAST